MRVDKIAKMLIGVENLVVQGVAYDEERDCIVISARPTLPHARECGKCGRARPSGCGRVFRRQAWREAKARTGRRGQGQVQKREAEQGQGFGAKGQGPPQGR